MRASIAHRLRHAALTLILALGSATVWSAEDTQQAAKAGPPAGFVAPAEPRADETNAQRSRTQPGNNAPLWRAVRESGGAPGVTTVQGPEAGPLRPGEIVERDGFVFADLELDNLRRRPHA